jgi:hypothetical protein
MGWKHARPIARLRRLVPRIELRPGHKPGSTDLSSSILIHVTHPAAIYLSRIPSQFGGRKSIFGGKSAGARSTVCPDHPFRTSTFLLLLDGECLTRGFGLVYLAHRQRGAACQPAGNAADWQSAPRLDVALFLRRATTRGRRWPEGSFHRPAGAGPAGAGWARHWR